MYITVFSLAVTRIALVYQILDRRKVVPRRFARGESHIVSVKLSLTASEYKCFTIIIMY